MTASWETPTELGLPLPLVPPDYLLPSKRPGVADPNHAFHAASRPELQGVSGQALRFCRVQRTDWQDHHMVYHRFYAGPAVPSDEAERFAIVVMAVARYVPSRAINCRGAEPFITETTAAMRDRFWQQNEIHVDRAGPVRNFLARYVSSQDLGHVTGSIIDEFIDTPDLAKQWFLGQWLVAQATQVAAEPLVPIYREARRLQLLPGGLTSRPENLVQQTLGGSFERSPVVKLLRERLAA